VFFGSPAFAVPALEAIAAVTDLVAVVTQPDRPAGRGQALSEPAVKQATRRVAPAVPILQPEKIRTGEFESRLRGLHADLFVVVAYGRILPPAILDLPSLGPWNVHASILPRLRGAAPIQWAIINGDQHSGVSIMRMEAGLDTGPVAAVATVDVRDDDTTGTLAPRLAASGADLLVKTLPSIIDGTVRLTAQDEPRATLAPLLKKEDGRLDFRQPARLVSARARGVDPWPGATASLDDGQLVKLFGARAWSTGGPPPATEQNATGAGAPPGTILRIDEAGLHVSCGEGRIVFHDVQLPGRKRMAAAAGAAGRAIAAGRHLG
jgi:methionyl-tRNA formyltransferase